jgi:hypothetical protein
MDDRGSIPGKSGAGIFSLRHRVQTGFGAHAASYPMGNKGSSPEVKWPKSEADHSPASNAEVKNAWICTSILLHAFMICCFVKYRIWFYGVVLS